MGRGRTRLSGTEIWLENIVLSGLDAAILGLPILLIILSTSVFPIERQHAALVALLTLAVGVGTIRGKQERVGARWPRMMASAVLLRAIYYNVTLALAAYGGAVLIIYWGLLAGTLFAAVVAGIAAVRLPRFTAWAYQSLPYQRRVDDWDG